MSACIKVSGPSVKAFSEQQKQHRTQNNKTTKTTQNTEQQNNKNNTEHRTTHLKAPKLCHNEKPSVKSEKRKILGKERLLNRREKIISHFETCGEKELLSDNDLLT